MNRKSKGPASANNPSEAAWIGTWRHSHEEDSNNTMVFRRLEYHFPPSRGRMGFQLEPDGLGSFLPVGRDDRERQQLCMWELSPEGTLSLRDRATGAMLFHGRVIRITASQLELSLSQVSPA